MRQHFLRSCLIAFAILIAGVNAQTQFLKKVSKGLEKVNKTLEKVENVVNNQPDQRTQTSRQQQTASTANTEVGWEQSSEENFSGCPFAL